MPTMKALFRVETRPETRGNVFIVFPEQPSTGPAMVEIFDPREGHTEASTRWVSQASRPARVGEFERVKEQYERRHGVELRSAGRYEPLIQYKRGAVRGERDRSSSRRRARRDPSLRSGDRAIVHGQKAIIRDYFPRGSTSYMFPHYKVDFVNGDRNVAVAVNYVQPYGGKRF